MEHNKKVRLVDGFKIRNTLDPEFCVLHRGGTAINRPFKRFYIPPNEYWLDYRYKDELGFLMRADKVKPPKRRKTYTSWREHIKEAVCLPPPIPEFVVSRRRRGRNIIVMINGAIVRQYIDPEFVLGGHDLAYSYIPHNEIWLDSAIDPKEVPFILLHEVVERDLMFHGKSYDNAHDYSTVAEKEMRRNKLKCRYPLDDEYPWRKLTIAEIIREYYYE